MPHNTSNLGWSGRWSRCECNYYHATAFNDCKTCRCDAEPGALAEYILALLRHNAPEADLRKELMKQLEEFLEKGAHA